MKIRFQIISAVTTGICLFALGLFLHQPAAFAQEDMTVVRSDALAPHTRAAATFVHDEHNEKAGIEDCAACHHGRDANGKKDMDDMSAGTPCAECHSVSGGKGITPLRRAFHMQCMGCHRETNRGPTNCGGCHLPS